MCPQPSTGGEASWVHAWSLTALLLWTGTFAQQEASPGCAPALPVVQGLAARTLTGALRGEVLDLVLNRVETRYIYLDYGGLDWPREKRAVRARALAAPSEAAFYTELKQLVARLGDDHSEFLTPTEARLKDAGGAGYVGVGLNISEREGERRVVAVTPGGPAERAGVRRGDVLLAVNGQTCPPHGATQGEVGSSVTLTLRAPNGRERTLTLRREAVGAPAPPAASRLPGAPGTGLLTLPSFLGDAAEAAQARLGDLLAGPPLEGLIVDVRGNGGGSGPVVRRMLGLFVTGPVAERRGREGEAVVITALDSPLRERLAGVPLAVLTDEGTASAAELFAGALQERGRARVVGSRSAANTEGVTPLDLPDGSRLWLSEIDVFLPGGRRLGDGGVTPDVVVTPEWGAVGTPQDPVLQRAAEELRRTGRVPQGP